MTTIIHKPKDSIARFTDAAKNYEKFRPGYPQALFDFINSICSLDDSKIVADIGSGTGILTSGLILSGAKVIGVEPNDQMRKAAEGLFHDTKSFFSSSATAEATGLDAGSVDVITSAQAFHWFDVPGVKAEWTRITKPNARVFLIWNLRCVNSSEFSRAFDQIFLKYCPELEEIRKRMTGQKERSEALFAPQKCENFSSKTSQKLDLEGLIGFVLSTSFALQPSDPKFEIFIAELTELFEKHAHKNSVVLQYDTVVRHGVIRSGTSCSS